MMIKSFQIRNYKGIKKAKINFVKQDPLAKGVEFHDVTLQPILLICNEIKRSTQSFKENPLLSCASIFKFLKDVCTPDRAEQVTKDAFQGCTGITFIRVVFGDDMFIYTYELRMQDSKVKDELLFCNQDLIYSHNSELRKVPRIPLGISKFFKNTLCINLAHFEQVNTLVNEAAKYCHEHPSFLEDISNILIKCGFTENRLIPDPNSDDNVYMYDSNAKAEISIHHVNRTVQAMFGIVYLTKLVLSHRRLLIVQDPGTLDFRKKQILLDFFKEITNKNKGAQIILLDNNSPKKYEGLFNSTTTAKLNLNTFVSSDDKFILEELN